MNESKVIKYVAYFIMLDFLILACLYYVDSVRKDTSLIDFQTDVQHALKAYSTVYKQDTVNMHSISLGYVTKDDEFITGSNTNRISIDPTLGNSLFKNMLVNSSGYTDTELNYSNFYIVNITTTFINGLAQYDLSIHDNKGVLKDLAEGARTMGEVQGYIEGTLGVKLDITYNYDASMRKAQEYKKDSDTTLGTYRQDVNSTYSTYMAIFLDVPLRGFWKTQFDEVREIQTYSILRSDY